jgi:putative endopeptidase
MTWDDVRELVGVDLDPWLDAVAPGSRPASPRST